MGVNVDVRIGHDGEAVGRSKLWIARADEDAHVSRWWTLQHAWLAWCFVAIGCSGGAGSGDDSAPASDSQGGSGGQPATVEQAGNSVSMTAGAGGSATTNTTGAGGATTGGGGHGGNGGAGGSAGQGVTSDGGHPSNWMPGAWVNATGNLANVRAVCGNSYRVWGVPQQDQVLAAVSRQAVYATSDGGQSWAIQGGATSPNDDQNGVIFDPSNAGTYWIAGMHVGSGVFKTTDGGNTFKPLGSISNIDDVSVDFTDPQRQTLIAGAHEQHALYKSTNGGTSFTDITASFPAGRAFTSAPIVVDAKTYVMGTAYYSADPNAGVFRTNDGGTSWLQMLNVSVGGSGLKTSWGTLYYGTRDGGAILKGSADGSAWQRVPIANGQSFSIVIELPGKRIATTARNGNVSTIVVSADDGATWKVMVDKVAAPTGWTPSLGPYLAYDSVRGAFFVSYWDCGNVVHQDAIWRYDVPG
jgi:hypothetical protein